MEKTLAEKDAALAAARKALAEKGAARSSEVERAMPVTPEESLDDGGPSRAISATTHLEDPSSKAPVDIRDAAGSAADLDAERQRLEAREAALAEREKRLE